MISLLREPLLHFLVLGAAIFALFAATDDGPPPASANRLEVTATDAARLSAQFEATWRRPPSPRELDGLIDQYVREEVYVREAEALGLDRGDAVIRQRLAQKMLFLTESGAEAVQPTDAELQAHLEAYSDRFARPPLVAFEQVPLADAEEAETILAALRGGAAPDTVGGPSLLPGAIPPSPERVVDGTFGAGFFAQIAALTPGEWAGPLPSAYGPHAVRLTASEPGRLPPLDTIREDVERDWRAEMRARLAQERLEALLSRYEIVRPTPETVLSQ